MAHDWVDISIVVATAAAAVGAFLAAAIAWVVFRQEHDPEVIVYAAADEARPSIILLVIENVGRRAARNVTFRVSRPLPAKAWGLTVADSSPATAVMTTGPLIAGIPYLGPRSTRQITWGQFGGLYQSIGKDGIVVTCNYTSDAIGWSAPREHETASLLEVASFDGTDATDPDGARQSAKQLKRIADVLEKRMPQSE